MVHLAKPKDSDQECPQANGVNDTTGAAASMPHRILKGKPNRVSFDLRLQYQHAVHCEGPCQKIIFVYTGSVRGTPQSACPHCRPSALMSIPQATEIRRRQGVFKPNTLRNAPQLDLEDDSTKKPPPEPATPMQSLGTRIITERWGRPDLLAE